MKILQIAPAYYPAISVGGPIFSTLAFTEILEKEYDVTTVTTQLGLNKLQISNIDYNKEIILSKSHSLVYKKYIGPPNITFSFSLVIWLIRNIKFYDIIILQGVWNSPFLFTSLFARLYKIPYIIFPHGTLYKETVNLNSRKSKLFLYALGIKSMLSNSKLICFTTNDEKNKVLDYLNLNLKSVVIPNVVKKDDFLLLPQRGKYRNLFSIGPDTVVLLHFGRITKKKGLEHTLTALSRLIKFGADVKLIIAGGNEEGYRSIIEKFITHHNLGNYVHFTGMLNREDTSQILVDSDIFVLPSYSENFGIAIVEAMYCKLSVVISNNVGISDDVKQNNAGFVFDFNANFDSNSEVLFQLLNKLIENRLLRNEIGAKGKLFAEQNYDTKVVYSSVVNLLNDLIKY